MKLNVLIKNEEKLLILESNHKFDLEFNDYLKLNKLLKNIGEITTNYFLYMKEYDNKLKMSDINVDERKNKLIELNNTLLNTDIDVNETEIEYFTSKYKIE